MSAKEIDLAALDRDLQNLKKPPKSRWARFFRWFLAILLLLLLAGGGGAYWFFQRVLSHEAYLHAMRKIGENEEIKTNLGAPITTIYLSPAPSIRQDSSETDILWTIAGSSGKQAKVHVFQRLMNGKWETSIAEVTLPDGKSGRKVSLIEEDDAGGAPLFNPQAAPPADAPPPAKPAEETMPEDLTPSIPKPEEAK
ncbi:MAG: hypothetical protein IT426_14850 [Pirellulales bacterium]|nr:hypothetical protein [Pirellulales bacterium]